MADYNSDEIHRTAVPPWVKIRGRDAWKRDWLIELISAPPQARAEELSGLSGDGIDVVCKLDGSTLKITTTTELNPRNDETFFVAPARMLQTIDRRVERIKAIEGQPREFWRVWLAAPLA
jgi:hypothetical protein